MMSHERITAAATERATARDLFIFVDNSNIWIEGQKVYADSATPDSQFRVNVSKLRELIAGDPEHRRVRRALLIGSPPSSTETFWDAAVRAKWDVQKKERSSWSGKEKKVDATINCQATKEICLTENSIIAIVAGDGDFLPVIDVFQELKHKNHSLEFWSWRRSLNQEYLSLPSDLISIHYLDDYIDTIGFAQTEYLLQSDRIPKNVSLVAVGMKDHERMSQFMATSHGFYYRNRGQDKIMIPAKRCLSSQEFYDMFEEVKSYFQELGDPNPIVTYVQYMSNHASEAESNIAVFNPFALLEGENEEALEGEDEEESMVESFDNFKISPAVKSGWQVIKKTEKRAKNKDDRVKNRVKNRVDMCWHGHFCNKKKQSCGYKHPADMKPRKVESCTNPDCPHSKNPECCNFLHPGEIPLCTWCLRPHQPDCFDQAGQAKKAAKQEP